MPLHSISHAFLRSLSFPTTALRSIIASMVRIVSDMIVTLPALHTSIIDSSSPPSPLSNDRSITLPCLENQSQHDEQYPLRSLPFPLLSHRGVDGHHCKRVSTYPMSPTPSLTYLPSPSPPSTRPCTPDSFLLVPCAFHNADAIVIIGEQPSTSDSSPSNKSVPSPRPTPPIFRPCKPSEARATLLIGPAISAHARKRAARGERRMHPYRIMRDRHDSVARLAPSSLLDFHHLFQEELQINNDSLVS